MKKAAVLLWLIIIPVQNACGQWYMEKYKVNDINLLTKDELLKEKDATKVGMLASGFVATIGGLILTGEKYSPYEEGEDPTIFQQFMGEKGMHTLNNSLGAIFLTGGMIGLVQQFGKFTRINIVTKRNYPSVMSISPSIQTRIRSSSIYPGITFGLNF